MKIVILGSTGMLGSAVGKYMINVFGEDCIHLSYRNLEMKYGKNNFYFDPTICSFEAIPECDYVINCIGITKPFIEENIINSIQINAVFPRALANWFKGKSKVIHITTDCVFSGKDGNYDEATPHDCIDIYGKTKSLGEPVDDCMVIRTSIIGSEVHKYAFLISWLKSQKGKNVNGFTNHLWNGITTKQYAKVCSQIIDEKLYQNGLFHAFSNSITKYELLNLLNKKFDLDVKIHEVECEISVDRTMTTLHDIGLKIPLIEDQIREMA